MTIQLEPLPLYKLAQMIEKAEGLLITSGRHYRSIKSSPLEQQKEAAFNFIKAIKKQIDKGQIDSSIEISIEQFIDSVNNLPENEREPAFRCVSNYNNCISESSSFIEKALCSVALIICFAKEVIPLA